MLSKKILVMLALILMGASQAAVAQIMPPIGHPGGGSGRPPEGQDQVSVRVDRQFHRDVVSIDQYLGHLLGNEDVVEVIAEMSTAAGRGQASLLLNGQTVDGPVVVGTMIAPYRFQVPGFSRRRGPWSPRGTGLDLQLNGNFYVRSLTAVLDRRGGGHGGGHRTQQVFQWVNQNFRGQNVINAAQYIDMPRLHGRMIQRVIIQASSRRGFGTAQLETGGRIRVRQPVQLGTMVQEHVFDLGSVILGRDISHIAFNLSGDIFVESIAIEFIR